MRFQNQLAACAGLASVALSSALPENTSLDARACPKFQIVALGGEGTTQGDLGYLQSTADAVQGAVPGSVVYQIGYPPGDSSPDAIAYATPVLQSHITSFASSCPNSKMILLGYSAGAAAVMDVLCGDANTGDNALASSYRHNILANIIYGDPTYIPGLSYQAGTCDVGDGEGEVPRQFPGHCHPFGRKTKSYCDNGDTVCCAPGTDPNIHFTYPSTYDSAAAAYVKSKYDEYESNN